jgi:hypothetical protein
MKIWAAMVLGLFVSALGYGQDAAANGLIEARQAEVGRLGVLYGISLNVGAWTHQQVAVCPAFTHHVFARYDQRGSGGATASFIAIYDLDTGPAKSLNRPWEGGIALLPLYGVHWGEKSFPIERKETMNVFNRVWADELQRSGSVAFSGLSWPGLADCYARLANEEPVRNTEVGDVGSPSINLKGEQVSAVLITVKGSDKVSRVAHLEFDLRGQVTRVDVNESPRAQ